ncbi:MAG: inorganic phosphate transporter [Bacteroidales bacterium]|jgi:phosphate/sulfate permease|nr:inorganic phosphate transporter [Bacteroidales bacterium]
MDNLYLIIVVLLLILAISDLMVGVANDAVNFLNSAVGSKAAPRKIILLIASLGILIGSIFSSGMMEVAKSGVFHPEMFHFHDIMILFLAVMLTDVILLDIFNSFGLPTSTTVSLVFALLGSAVAVSLYIINTDPQATSLYLAEYINSTKAMAIISGILSSVVIAFICGTIVMYLSRLLFTFHYEKPFKFVGAIWCGLAFMAITYFAIFKGLKSTSLLSKEDMKYLQEHTGLILFFVFVGSSGLYAILQHLFRINILKVTILIGTASLALAFAGNDLVNFIGVPMAGLSSYEIASEAISNGADIGTLTMNQLREPVQADWRILIAGGAIMVSALWFSKKARKVTATEVNLSRQDGGVERFGSTQSSRALVRSAVKFSKAVGRILPDSATRFIDHRFRPLAPTTEEKASFDLIRASVNLTVATLLISVATSLKLPLSTTYVTFMVAMGSSLADRAWGRESAVYRITGVLTVISGWFLTALAAFMSAGIIALILMFASSYGQIPGIIGVVTFGVFALFFLFKTSEFGKKTKKLAEEEIEELTGEQTVYEYGNKGIKKSITQTNDIYTKTLDALFTENRRELKHICEEADKMYKKAKNKRKHEVLPNLERLGGDNMDLSFYYIQVVDYNYEISKSLLHITRESYDYINNNHEGFSEEQIQDLKSIMDTVNAIYTEFLTMLDTKDYSNFDELMKKREVLNDVYADSTKHQIKRAKANLSGTRNTILFLYIITETRTLILQSRNLMKSQRKLAMTNE